MLLWVSPDAIKSCTVYQADIKILPGRPGVQLGPVERSPLLRRIAGESHGPMDVEIKMSPHKSNTIN